MKKEKKINGKKAGVRTGLIAGIIIVSLIIAFNVPKPVIEIEDSGTWHVVWEGSLAQAAENNPGAGASGFLEFFCPNHTATPATAYDENSSAEIESWCVANMPGKTPYASADNFRIELDHSVSHDWVVRARFNKTHCWDGAKFIDTRCRINLTVSGDNTLADVTGTLVVTRNNTGEDYLWVNVYWATGYTINADGGDSYDEISIEAKY